jgi:adenine-specific DNA-methyltransferase
VPIESRQIAGKAVHNVGAGALMVCLSDGIDAKWPNRLRLASQNGKSRWPRRWNKLVFKDSAFADDVAKTNLAAILNQHGLVDVRSI